MLWKRTKRKQALELGKDTFKYNIENKPLVFAFFEAPWCGACKILHPILDDLAHENKDQQELIIGVVNTDYERELSQEFNIRSLPALLVFHNKRMVFQGSGMISKPRLQEIINNLLNNKNL